METKRLQVSKSGDVSIEFALSETLERYDALALEALDECRKSILMAMRFLSSALWYLPFERTPLSRTLSTSGTVLQYDPENVIDRYRSSDNELTRDCLHAILHCVFHHPFDARHDDFDAWSLACDIAVEQCILDLCGARFSCNRDDERREALERLGHIARNLTAPALYQVLRSGGPGEQLYVNYGISAADIVYFRELFKRDEHTLWAGHPHEGDSDSSGNDEPEKIPDLLNSDGAEMDLSELDDAMPPESAESAGDGSSEAEQAESADDTEAVEEDADDGGDSEDPSSTEGEDGDQLEQGEEDPQTDEAQEDWERMSKQIEVEMRSQLYGTTAGDSSLLLNLSVANRKPANYEEFLKKFATVAEDMRINDDEFDYIYYTYGLNHYGNIPLVEPLEYTESERVREFVIALDTSGSCSGELIRTFVTRTYDILRQQTSFGDEINVHLIQCDSRIQSATKVESLAQLEEYSDSFWVSGGGGTDFKPVFEYVDKLVEDGEFSDLRGLIYFTDGYGAFPVKAPAYDVAFVFVEPEGMSVRVPAWAMKVLMTREEILQDE